MSQQEVYRLSRLSELPLNWSRQYVLPLLRAVQAWHVLPSQETAPCEYDMHAFIIVYRLNELRSSSKLDSFTARCHTNSQDASSLASQIGACSLQLQLPQLWDFRKIVPIDKKYLASSSIIMSNMGLHHQLAEIYVPKRVAFRPMQSRKRCLVARNACETAEDGAKLPRSGMLRHSVTGLYERSLHFAKSLCQRSNQTRAIALLSLQGHLQS